MPAQPTEIDLRGKSLEEVMYSLKSNRFSASSTEISLWNFEGAKPGPELHVVWIEDGEAPMLTVTVFNGMLVTLEPGMNLHLSDRPEGLLSGQDWFVARTLDLLA